MGNGASRNEDARREMFMKSLKEELLANNEEEQENEEIIAALKKKAAEICGDDGECEAVESTDDDMPTIGALRSFTTENVQQHNGVMLESISQVAATHVLERTAEMRASYAKKNFGREATDTSMGSSSSADKETDLASLLPPPRINLSIDVEAVNGEGGGEQEDSGRSAGLGGDETPRGGQTKRSSSGKKFHLVDFHDGNSKETWVISDDGAMRLDEYNVKIGGGGLESTQQGSVTALVPSDFLIISELGKGSGGRVYKALHKPTLTLVAVKELPMASASKRASLKKELKVLYTQLQGLADDKPKESYVEMLDNKAYRSNHIVSFYDAYSTEDGFAHLVMELMNGGSLQDLIDRGGCRNEAVLGNIALGMAEGLKELHENKFLHRDLKPANVMMGTDGFVKVADFGVSKDLASSKDLAQTFIGTFLYMSPERIAGEEYDSKADIWGLGMTLLASFLGRFPHEISDRTAAYWEMWEMFVAQDEHHMEDQIVPAGGSEELRDFIAKCLSKNPAHRPTASELLGHQFLTKRKGQAVVASDPEQIEQAKKAEILEVVTCCKENGVKFPRKTTNFKIIARQVGVTEDYCKDMFCPRKSKQRQGPERKSSTSNIGQLAKEGLKSTRVTMKTPLRALKRAFSNRGHKDESNTNSIVPVGG